MAISSITAAVVVLAVLAIGFRISGVIGGGTAGHENTALVSAGNEIVAASTGSISIPGYETLTMKAGQINQDVELFNPEGNPCYMRIEILLPDGTSIFRSGMIEPGKGVNSIQINRPLEAGTYKGAVMRFSNYSLEGRKELNGAETIFTLEVK